MASDGERERQRLFDLFTRQPGHQDLTQGVNFYCPLCRRPFGREALATDNLLLTLAHIIPNALGGTWTTLACIKCNNDSGCELEAELAASRGITDWVQGRGSLEVRIGENGHIHATSTCFPAEKRLHFKITTPMTSRAVTELKRQRGAVAKSPSGAHEFHVKLPWYRPKRCWAAVCQSAYLLLFRQFGYDFARNSSYRTLWEQIQKPDERVFIGNIHILSDESASWILENHQAAVVFVREPVRALMAVLRLRSRGGVVEVLGVMLPGPSQPALEPVDLRSFSGAVVPYDPEFMAEQQGYLWLRWHMWLQQPEGKKLDQV